MASNRCMCRCGHDAPASPGIDFCRGCDYAFMASLNKGDHGPREESDDE